MKRRSILESVVDDMVNETTMNEFVDKIHNESGLSKDKLSKIYSKGITESQGSGKNPVTFAKAKVYSYVERQGLKESSVKKSNGLTEGPVKQHAVWDSKDEKWVSNVYNNYEVASDWADKLNQREGSSRYQSRPYVNPEERKGKIDHSALAKRSRELEDEISGISKKTPKNENDTKTDKNTDDNSVEGLQKWIEDERISPEQIDQFISSLGGTIPKQTRDVEFLRNLKTVRNMMRSTQQNEGDVVPFKKDVKHCTCPFDNEDETKDLGVDPNCPYHGKKVEENKERPDASLECKHCHGDGCKKCDFSGRIKLESKMDGIKRLLFKKPYLSKNLDST